MFTILNKRLFKSCDFSWIPLVSGIFISYCLLTLLFPHAQAKHETYKDIISEVSNLNMNKSGELAIVWGSLMIGLLSMLIIILCSKKESSIKSTKLFSSSLYSSVICLPIIIAALIRDDLNSNLILLVLIYIFVVVWILVANRSTNKILPILITSFIGYMLLLSIWSLLQYWGLNGFFSENLVRFLSALFLFTLLIFCEKCNFSKLVLFMQIPLPLLLLVYLNDNYYYQKNIIQISYSTGYILCITSLICIGIFLNIFLFLKRYKCLKEKANPFSNCIFLTTIILVFIIYSHQWPQSVHYTDLWHSGEQLLPWDQIVTKGMIPYKDYSPASGLYPMLFGFINELIVKNGALGAGASNALEYILFSIITGVGCYYSIGSTASLLLAILIPIPDYNRPFIFLPVLLWLSNEKIVKRRVFWLQSWFICCFFAGLWYPLNGVAIAVGTLPFAVIQFYYSYKEKLIKKEAKSIRFWFINLVSLALLIPSMPMLYRMLKHVLAMSSQSTLADGVPVYTIASVKKWFLPFISDDSLRQLLFSGFIYIVTFIPIFFFSYLLLIYSTRKGIMLKNKITSPAFLLLSCGAIAIPINYTFTYIRMDPDGFVMRSGPTICIFGGYFLFVFLWKYGAEILGCGIKNVLIGTTLAVCLLVQDSKIGQETHLLQESFFVDSGFEFVDGKEIGLPKLGKGFLPKDIYSRINNLNADINKLLKNEEGFLDMSFSQELYYIFDIKAPVPNPGTYIVSSKAASASNINKMEENPPEIIIYNVSWFNSALRNYYIYNWLMDQGYILYSNNDEDYLINPSKFEEVIGNSQIAHTNMVKSEDCYKLSDRNLKGTPNSWGKSMKTLSSKFNAISGYTSLTDFQVNTNQISALNDDTYYLDNIDDPFLVFNCSPISGKKADFIYLDLISSEQSSNNKTVTVYYETDVLNATEGRSFSLEYGDGKLLIPMGIQPGWRFGNVKNFRIDFNGFQQGDKIHVNSIQLLKLDTVFE